MKLLVPLALMVLVGRAEVPVDIDYHNTQGVPAATRIEAAEKSTKPDGSNIVGGSPAALGQYPYFGGLIITLVDGRTSLCGCSLLSNTRAATAAHCWRTLPSQARRFTVVLGSTRLFSGGTRVDTSDVEVHASYNTTTFGNDIAVIRMPRVEYNDNIRNILLATGSNNFAGTLAWAVGFGATAEGAAIAPNQSLSHVSMRVITNAQCAATYGSRVVQASTLCAGADGGHGTCGGDSGGPLVADNKLIGVTSFGRGCQQGYPVGFSRVTSYASWIQARL